MILTPEIKKEILVDIMHSASNNRGREAMLSLKKHGIKSTRETRDEIISWLNEELEIERIYPNGDIIDIFLK